MPSYKVLVSVNLLLQDRPQIKQGVFNRLLKQLYVELSEDAETRGKWYSKEEGIRQIYLRGSGDSNPSGDYRAAFIVDGEYVIVYGLNHRSKVRGW